MQHYTRFLQFFYELNIFNLVGSFILNALAYSFFFITSKLHMLDNFDNNDTSCFSVYINNNNSSVNNNNSSVNINNNNSELYNIFINKYKIYILEKYNFSLEIVNEQQFNELLEIFNNHNKQINYFSIFLKN